MGGCRYRDSTKWFRAKPVLQKPNSHVVHSQRPCWTRQRRGSRQLQHRAAKIEIEVDRAICTAHSSRQPSFCVPDVDSGGEFDNIVVAVWDA